MQTMLPTQILSVLGVLQHQDSVVTREPGTAPVEGNMPPAKVAALRGSQQAVIADSHIHYYSSVQNDARDDCKTNARSMYTLHKDSINATGRGARMYDG